MIRLLVVLSFLFISVTSRADHLPLELPSRNEKELILRGFYKIEKWNPLVELIYQPEVDERRIVSLRLGTYYRLFKNLKVGAFFQRQYGLRHDDDWVIDSSGGWHWNDTRGRSEDVWILDATPRLSLESLLGRGWIAELKTRFHWNTFNENKSLRVRPGLSYFWIRDGEPFLSFFGRVGLYFPLNFSNKTIYENRYYFGGLYHFSKWLQIGPQVAFGKTTWTDSQDFKTTHPDENYEIQEKVTTFSLVVIFRLGN